MKLLLVEDNKFDADLVTREIIKGMQEVVIDVVSTISEARTILQKKKDYQLVLLDINLPDGNGLELLVNIHEKRLPLAVIVLTGSGDEEQAVTALKAGADDYLVKGSDHYSKLPEVILHNIARLDKKSTSPSQILHILYLEHHKLDIDLTTRHFKKYAPHLQIEYAASEQQILELLKESNKPECYHVLLMDYNLPEMSVLRLIKIIRQERKLDIPIIIVTGQGSEEIAIQALKLGADEYLVKRENYLNRLPSLIQGAYQRCLLKHQKEDLQESEARYKLLAENAGDVIFTLDMNFNFTYVSPSVLHLRGYSPEELINENIATMLTQESYQKVIEIVTDFKQTSGIHYEPVVLELEVRKKDNSLVWTEVKASALYNDSSDFIGVLGVTRDISFRKKAEQELIKAKEKAEENDSLKSAFLANMSHEIRTPMNGILGFTELLKSNDLSVTKKEEYLRVIEQSGNRLLNIINDLIDISKIESGQMELNISEVHINDLMWNLFDFFNLDIRKKNLKFHVNNTLDSHQSIISTDKNKLNTILTNLVKNAIKFTTTGSVEYGYFLKGGYLEFYIKDTGMGIPEEKQFAIFERFVQADNNISRPHEGAGLGLSISKAYVEMLGGKIWMDSQINKGSTFYFTLPYNHKPEISNINNIPVTETRI